MRANCILSKTSTVHMRAALRLSSSARSIPITPHFLISNFALTAIDVRRTCA
jgi:hypothetical protein